MPPVELKNLVFETEGKKILNDFSMTIESSEVHALLGTNGTGKSTLAYLVMGCEGYKPTSGEIVFDGKVINDLRIHERAQLGITMAWQEPVRFEGITVKDYLTMKRKNEDPSQYLEIVGLSPELYVSRIVDKRLSGGERKRIELASIVAMKPRFAILDEPDTGIDMLSTQDIINVIKIFKKNGSSVLLITHREEIALIADKASQICQGKVIFSGSPHEVTEYYKAKKCLICKEEVCAYV